MRDIVKAAQALSAKLEEVHASSAYKDAWGAAQTTLGTYKGPSYAEEHVALRDAITEEACRSPEEFGWWNCQAHGKTKSECQCGAVTHFVNPDSAPPYAGFKFVKDHPEVGLDPDVSFSSEVKSCGIAKLTCEWKHTAGGSYDTGCGDVYDTNIMWNYCPGCGRKIKVSDE